MLITPNETIAPRAQIGQRELTDRNVRIGRSEAIEIETIDSGGRKDLDAQSVPERSGRSEGADRSERSEYGPPPGYQPIILPGESISKYQRLAQSRPAPREERPVAVQGDRPVPISEIFATDEPLFAESVTVLSKSYEEPVAATHEPASHQPATQ